MNVNDEELRRALSNFDFFDNCVKLEKDDLKDVTPKLEKCKDKAGIKKISYLFLFS
jgi:hypothetical protein